MRLGLVLTAVVTLFLAGMAPSRAPQDSMEARALRERVEATPSFQGLVRYPQKIRYAILELSQDPTLLLRLNYLPEEAVDEREKILGEAPAEIRKAARILLEEPEVLDILTHHLELTTMVGVVYKQNKKLLKTTTDQGHERTLKKDEESVEAWAQQLHENPKAAQEFFEAEQDYEQDEDLTEEEEYTGEPDYGYEEDDDDEYGYYGLPPYGYTRYALRHANRYPNLANSMVQQWQRGGNVGTFQNAGDGWWDRHKDLVDDNFLKDGPGRIDRLKENARFDQQLREDLGRRADDPTARRNYLAQHGDRYPHLKKHQRPVKATAKKNRSAGPRKSSAGVKKHKKTPRNKPKKVSSKRPTKKQQTHRANKNMRRSHGGHHRSGGRGRRR